MHTDLIPDAFTPAVVCRILNCDRAFLEDVLARGVIHMDIIAASVSRSLIARADVEKLAGRQITIEDVAEAWHRGDGRRQVNRRYYVKRMLAKAVTAANICPSPADAP